MDVKVGESDEDMAIRRGYGQSSQCRIKNLNPTAPPPKQRLVALIKDAAVWKGEYD